MSGFRRLDPKGFLRGWEMHRAGRRRARGMAERWAAAISPSEAEHTRLRSFKGGVLRINVDSSALLQELVTYRRAGLLERINADGAQPAVVDIRFEIGVV